ncbi:MAG: cation diffusion facilitator family transporter [Thiotrichales bacterium]
MTAQLEQRALKFSLAGTVVMAVFGIGFGLYLNASAILLDGFFSFLSMGMTGLSLFTSYLIQRPEDRRFQFGYAHLEPLMNSVNGIVILAVCSYSLVSGVSGLLSGGNRIPFDLALYYAVPIMVLCLLLYLYETWMAGRLNSELLRVDSREWLVDTILTSTLTLGFLLGWYLETTRFAAYAPYLDPMLVIVLSGVAMVIPYRVLKRNVGEVLGVAPPEMARFIRQTVSRALLPYQVRMVNTHVAKLGRRYDIEINVLIDEASPLFNTNLETLDALRDQLSNALKMDPSEHWISISFTQDPEWL